MFSLKAIQFIFSLLILLVYIALIGTILFVEVSDNLNMEQGVNSMMGELKILIGVLTAGVGQVLNFWLKPSDGS